MSKTDPYFQFPVAILKGESDTAKVAGKIVRYSLWKVALHLQSESPQMVPQLAEQYRPLMDDYDEDNEHHAMLLASAYRLNIQIGSIEGCIAEGVKLHETYGVMGTQCRLRSDYVWSASGDNWPILKFQTLCGVIAGVGSDGPRRLNHRMIQAIGAGFNSPKGLKESQLLPKSSVRYWLEQLWYKNMFQFCKRGHERWYSIGLPGDAALAEAVKAMPAKRHKKTAIDVDAI